jgi:ERF superfamily
MVTELKDVTPKERVRVQAGRGGGPKTMQAVAVRQSAPTPAVTAPPADFLSLLYQMAIDPRVDVEKMKAGLDMQERIENRDAVKAFTRDFIALQDVLPIIDKDGKIDHGAGKQKNLYSTYPNIMKVCKPLLKAHGFALASWVEPEAGGARIVVVSQLDHVEHHHRTSRFPLPNEQSGSKNPVQGWGSTQQYGMRYNAIALLNIVSEAPGDRDTDGRVGNFKNAKGGGLAEVPDEVSTITAAQKETLLEKINWCGVSLAKFHEHYGIEKTADLPANLFDAAVKACEDFHANKQAKERHG